MGLAERGWRYENRLKSSKTSSNIRKFRSAGQGRRMKALSSTDIFLFEGFRVDRRGLFRRDEGDAAVPVEIGSRALDVLAVLLERPGELLSRDEIMAAAWPGVVVEDNYLTVQISALRHVLDRHGAQAGCIQTVPGRGYRFVAPVSRVEPTTLPASEPRPGDGQLRDAVAPGWASSPSFWR